MAAEAASADASGWYLYGIVAAEAEVAPREAAVDPEHAIVRVAEGAVAGVASRVSLFEFDEEALRQRLADAEWLESKIRAHERVLEAVLAATAVVPCRFCTVYRSEDDLRRFLGEHGDSLADALANLDGRVELGVKAYLDRDRLLERQHAAEQAQSGRAYLEARREEQRAGAELLRFQSELATDLHERLGGASEDGVVLDLQSRQVSGRDEEMVFNGAYLVDVGGRTAFEAALAAAASDHRDRGVELELTGPWPPYNFVPSELGRS